jgi:hypothetical protein
LGRAVRSTDPEDFTRPLTQRVVNELIADRDVTTVIALAGASQVSDLEVQELLERLMSTSRNRAFLLQTIDAANRTADEDKLRGFARALGNVADGASLDDEV